MSEEINKTGKKNMSLEGNLVKLNTLNIAKVVQVAEIGHDLVFTMDDGSKVTLEGSCETVEVIENRSEFKTEKER